MADTATHGKKVALAHGVPTNTGYTNEKLGMWLFLGSECLLFGALISTYLLYNTIFMMFIYF